MDELTKTIASRGDLAHLALFLWASGASGVLVWTLRELARANQRFEDFVKEIAALNRAAARARAPANLIAALCDSRIGFLRRLATFTVFGKGWTRRVTTIRTAALAMAGASLPSTKRTTEMNLFSGYKTYIVAAIMLLIGLAGVFGIDVPAFDGQAPMSLVMEALAFIFLRKGLKSDISNE